MASPEAEGAVWIFTGDRGDSQRSLDHFTSRGGHPSNWASFREEWRHTGACMDS